MKKQITSHINPKNLFLIDGLGTLLLTFLLGVIFVQFESAFGLPKLILYPLAMAAFVFSSYAFICYLLFKEDPGPYLKVMSIVNVFYACTTVFVVIYFFEQITALGLFYFVLELIFLLALACIEHICGSLKSVQSFNAPYLRKG